MQHLSFGEFGDEQRFLVCDDFKPLEYAQCTIDAMQFKFSLSQSFSMGGQHRMPKYACRTFCCQTALGCRTQTPSPPGSPGTKPQKKAAATQKRTLFKPRRRIPTGRRRIRPWSNAPFSGCIGGCGPQGRQGPVDCELHIVIQET